KEIGRWTGTDYETSQIEEALNADVILMRAYQSPGFYQPIFLLIVQSSDPGSFHPPPICYPALGYQIEEEGKEEIPLLNVDWVSYWRSETEQNIVTSINANKLVVFKEFNGKVTERRVVLYFYVKERPVSKDELALVRVSALAPIDMSYDGVLSLTRDFTGKVVPYLFEFYEEKEVSIAAHLAKSGAGRLLIAVSVIIPLAIMIYPRRRQR
ncbi:MAG: exosortase-associated EpsI family protein, partial [Thermodesulfobacteriota bacterium]